MPRRKKKITRTLFLENAAGPPLEIFAAGNHKRPHFLPVQLGRRNLTREKFDMSRFLPRAEAAFKLANDHHFRKKISWISPSARK